MGPNHFREFISIVKNKNQGFCADPPLFTLDEGLCVAAAVSLQIDSVCKLLPVCDAVYSSVQN